MPIPTYELILDVPDMREQVDQIAIQQVLSNSPGIDIVDADWRTHTLRVRTANQDGGVDVVKRLAYAGYPIAE